MEVQIVDIDNSLQCEHSSIRFSRMLSVQNGENTLHLTSEVLVQVIQTTKAREKSNAWSFFPHLLSPQAKKSCDLLEHEPRLLLPCLLFLLWFGAFGGGVDAKHYSQLFI